MFLGYKSTKTSKEDENDIYISKIGGDLPKVILKNTQFKEYQKCLSCSEDLWLLIQVHAPTDLDNEDEARSLFVLACNNSDCKARTWKALRYQEEQVKDEKPVESLIQMLENIDLNTKRTPVKSTSKVIPQQKQEREVPNSILTWGTESKSQISLDVIESLLKKRDDIQTNVKETKTQKSSKEPSKNLTDSGVTSCPLEKEDVPLRPETNIPTKFSSFYVEFEEEPVKVGLDKDISKKYKSVIENVNNNEEWKGEKYESNMKDETFFKFQKRLERSPTQCIRYSRGGDPLYISDQQPKSIPSCPTCRKARTFELQILPSLIYILESNDSHLHCDFGTVSIFTCSNSDCSKHLINEEYCFVQSQV